MRKLWLIPALLAASLAAHAQADLGRNLIVNGDAEAGTAGWTGFEGYSLFQSVDYGNNWVKPSEPGPGDRGARMFAGQGGQSAGHQTFTLGDLGSAPVRYELTGWLGGWLAQEDNALLYVSFLDITGQEIGHAEIGPMMPADRGNVTGLFLQRREGLLPVGTAQLMFSLSMERLSGGDNDGYADNLSFVLSAVPEPMAAWYAVAGLGTVMVAARRRSAARA